MQISANQTNYRNDPGLELGLREQQETKLSPFKRPIPSKDQTNASEQGATSRYYYSSSSSSKKNGIYIQAIRAYQEASRFEENGESGASIGDIFGKGVVNEKTLTNILREEPTNSRAWADLGLLYHTQGNRDKVSAIYQILQELDVAKADTFATQVRLHEKMLFTVA
jgi:hypothetical protein